jgi:hypothetical protein
MSDDYVVVTRNEGIDNKLDDFFNEQMRLQRKTILLLSGKSTKQLKQ